MTASSASPLSGDEPQSIVLPPDLTVQAIDEALATAGSDNLALDLGGVVKYDSSSLVYLAACASTLAAAGTTITFLWPAEAGVLIDVSARYGFPRAIQMLLASPIAGPGGFGTTTRVLTTQERTQNRLALIEPMSRPSREDAAVRARSWNDLEVRALLTHLLGPKSHLVGPGIVYEALANVAMHPRAAKVLASASVSAHEHGGFPNGCFEIVLWDDGESIEATLAAGLRKHPEETKPREEFDVYYANYRVHDDEQGDPWTVYSGNQVSPESPAGQLLLSATFPGVTRDPVRDDDNDRPGMGLFVLTSLALGSFGGEVEIRTSGASAFLQSCSDGSDDCAYQATVRTAPVPHLRGNFLVVRLPLVS